MKKYIAISFLLIALSSIQISFWYENCDKQYQKYLSTYEEVEELVEEKSQLKKKLETQYPSASPTFIMKKYNKETEELMEKYYALEKTLDNYWDDFNTCKNNTEKLLEKEDNLVKEYFQRWYDYHSAWDYLNAIKYYKKAEAVYSTKEAKSNLSLAYFEYANGRVYKEQYDEAIKYYNLALKSGYLHTYNIHYNIGLCYYYKAEKNNFDDINLKQALNNYEKALEVTSDYTEIKKVKVSIEEIQSIFANKAKQEQDEQLENQRILERKQQEKENKRIYEAEKIQEEKNEKLKEKANKVLDKIDDNTQSYSDTKRLKLYNKYIELLTNYSETKAQWDLKFIVDFIIKVLQRKVDNNFEPTLEDVLGL